MKLLLLTILLLDVVAARGEGRVTTLGRVRGNAEDRDLKGTSKTKKSNIFHSKSKSQCSSMFLGELITDPAEASVECNATLASANQLGCSHNIPGLGSGICPTASTAGYTSADNMCLAGGDSTGCYDLGDGLGQVAVHVKSAWDWSTYSANKCANILTYDYTQTVGTGTPGTITLKPNLVDDTPTFNSIDATAGACYDLSPLGLIDPGPTIDSTVTITVLSTGDSYTGEIISGGTVCEAWLGTAGINDSRTPFKITIEGQDYQGYIEVAIAQTLDPLFPIVPLGAPNLFLWQV